MVSQPENVVLLLQVNPSHSWMYYSPNMWKAKSDGGMTLLPCSGFTTRPDSSSVPPSGSCLWSSPPSWACVSACVDAVRTAEGRCTRDRGRTPTVRGASTPPRSSPPPPSSCESPLSVCFLRDPKCAGQLDVPLWEASLSETRHTHAPESLWDHLKIHVSYLVRVCH